jgi:DNA ligase (NAD+)
MNNALFTFEESNLSTDVVSLPTEKLVSTLENANAAYRSGEALISDECFDASLSQLKEIDPEHPFITSVQPEPLVASKGRIIHPKKMLSTDKVYTKIEMEKWLDKVIKAGLKQGIPPQDIVIVGTSKLDGIAARYTHGIQQLCTRGNGEEGNCISSLLNSGVVITGNNDKDGIGELVIAKKYFQENLSDDFSHARGFIAGIAGSDTISEHGLKALKDGAVELVIFDDMFRLTSKATDFMESFEEMENKLLDCKYDVDGVIFDVHNLEIQTEMGYTTSFPLYRIAKKRVSDAKITRVTGIRWQNGRTGTLCPVIEVEEVLLSNNRVTSITAHNAGFLLANNIGIGARILCTLSGKVIPKYLETIEPATPFLLSHCLSCNTPTTLNGDNLSCDNAQCEQNLVSAMFYSFKRLGIDLFGRKACEKLIRSNVKSVCEVIILNHDEFVLSGFGQGQASNFIAEISRAKREQLSDALFLSALGVKHLGRGASKKILSHYNINDVIALTTQDITSIDGLGELSAKVIIDELVLKGSILTFLLGLNFNLVHTKQENGNVTHSALTGLTVVFTGKMLSGSRSELEQKATQYGAKIGKTISKNTNILIVGEGVGESKMNKAKDAGTKIVTEDEYLKTYF